MVLEVLPQLKGEIGVYKVLIRLLELGVNAVQTPDSWSIDIITQFGLKLEVKHANGSTVTKREYSKYYFKLSKKEMTLLDYLILVLAIDPENKKDLFFVIPKNELTSLTVSFNPFPNRQKSKYLKFRDRFDLVVQHYKELEKLARKYDLKNFTCL